MVHVPESQGIDLRSVDVAVVGYKGAQGSSLMRMLHDMGVNPYGVDRHNSSELPDVVRGAGVVFSTANKAGLITPDMLTDASKLVVDAAIIPLEDGSGVIGSVDPTAYEDDRVRSSITPVPGGVGVLNTAMVFNNLRGAIEQCLAA
jgi:5,10-methylene-tetrahydrofolate dehydrogenase/methenyl tetrahydrofolate cyclohydrolase